MTQSGRSDQRLKYMEKQESKLPTIEAPYIEVFKFRPVNKYTLDSLIKKQLYFSSPAELNDPHDCQVDIEQSIRSAIGETTGKQRADLELLLRQKETLASLRSNLDCSGVCSFSNKLLNPVMWSHYADGHRGIGLYYQIPEAFILDNAMGMQGVSYGDSLMTDWLKTNKVSFDADYLFLIIKRALTIKGKVWDYERELRFIRRETGGLDINPSFLREISFGLRTPDHDKELLRRIVHSHYDDCTFVQVKRGTSDFGLIAIDL